MVARKILLLALLLPMELLASGRGSIAPKEMTPNDCKEVDYERLKRQGNYDQNVILRTQCRDFDGVQAEDAFKIGFEYPAKPISFWTEDYLRGQYDGRPLNLMGRVDIEAIEREKWEKALHDFSENFRAQLASVDGSRYQPKSWRDRTAGAPQANINLLFDLNVLAARLWDRMVSCTGDEERARRAYYEASFNCGEDPDLMMELSRYHHGIRQLFETAEINPGERIGMLPSVHPLFSQIMLGEIASWLPVFHSKERLISWGRKAERDPRMLLRMTNSSNIHGFLPEGNCNYSGLWPSATYSVYNYYEARLNSMDNLRGIQIVPGWMRPRNQMDWINPVGYVIMGIAATINTPRKAYSHALGREMELKWSKLRTLISKCSEREYEHGPILPYFYLHDSRNIVLEMRRVHERYMEFIPQ